MTERDGTALYARLEADETSLRARYQQFVDAGMALDMTRGKPCAEQLDLSIGLLATVGPDDYRAADGTDCRNYGGVPGLPEARKLLADLMGVDPNEVLIGDNASLTLMHDSVARAISHGVPGGNGPWRGAKFICPAPGYDRHFAVCEHFGVEMIPVDMGPDGPDMDRVEALVANDPTFKGMWIVPRYSNPTGITLSDATVERLASMKTAAPDFRLMWDDAYRVHHLTDDPAPQRSILAACRAAGCEDRPLTFVSTSKITFAGAGICAMAGSAANIEWMTHHRSKQTIGPDKLNQLRHVRFFGDADGVVAHMKKHAAIIGPKFDAVHRGLDAELGELVELGIAAWTRPRGGYFISFDTMDGCARRVVSMAADAGVRLTGAGATFPYRRDPRDRNIRIAPSLPSLADLEKATEVFAVCVRLATLEALRSKGGASG